MSTKTNVKLRRKPRAQAPSQPGVFYECCQRWYPAAMYHQHTPEVKDRGRSV